MAKTIVRTTISIDDDLYTWLIIISKGTSITSTINNLIRLAKESSRG